MDGNGRWAKAQGKSRQYGHKIGSSKVYDVFKQCAKLGCKSATFFAMSSENMLRSDKETEYISALLKSSIEEHFSDLLSNKTNKSFLLKKDDAQQLILNLSYNNSSYNYSLYKLNDMQVIHPYSKIKYKINLKNLKDQKKILLYIGLASNKLRVYRERKKYYKINY